MRKPGEELHYHYVTFKFTEGGLEIHPTPEGVAAAREYLAMRAGEADSCSLGLASDTAPGVAFVHMIEDALGNGWQDISGHVALWDDNAEILSEGMSLGDDGRYEPHETGSAESPCVIYIHTAYAVVLPVEAFADRKPIFLVRDEIELEPKDRVIRILGDTKEYVAEVGRCDRQRNARRFTKGEAHRTARELCNGGLPAYVARLMPKTKSYLVTWNIDVDADSPEDAARQARDLMPVLGSDSTATVFAVQECRGDTLDEPVEVDVADE